jgi:hypothetical protein
MFYNTDLDNDIDRCSDDWKPISLNGGYADFEVLPFDLPKSDPISIYNNIAIFNDRTCPVDPALKSVTLNGGGSNFDLRGVVYSPRGQVYVNGNSATDPDTGEAIEFTLDQVIAYTYTLNGNGGSILALNDGDYGFELRAVGLIE